jgi:hypothetical protein
MTQADNEAVEQLKSALQTRVAYPEYAHKVRWAVRHALYEDLLRYGRAWEATSGPIEERGGSPMEVSEEIVAEAEHALVSRMVALMDAALDAAEAEKRAAVAEERERCLNLVPDGSDEWYENLRPVHVKRMLAVLRAAIRYETNDDPDGCSP